MKTPKAESWKDIVFFDSVIERLVGEALDEINNRRQQKKTYKNLFKILFKKDGGNSMSRRIGNFYDEKTGETHWLEPETVKDYPLPPGRIAEFGHHGYKTVNYALRSNEEAKTIELIASAEFSIGKVVKSDAVIMDELRFAELLFNSYMNDQTFANLDEIKAFTQRSLASLAVNAYKKHGIILDGLELNGFGSIFYGKDRIATFDGIKVKLDPYKDSAEFSLINSVSHTTLSAEKNPSVTFIAEGHELTIPSFEFIEVQAGVVTQYKIQVDQLTTTSTKEECPFQYSYDDTITSESPYMKERIALLASAELEDDSFEDRFDDIFQL